MEFDLEHWAHIRDVVADAVDELIGAQRTALSSEVLTTYEEYCKVRATPGGCMGGNEKNVCDVESDETVGQDPSAVRRS